MGKSVTAMRVQTFGKSFCFWEREEVVCINTITRNQNVMACSGSALFSSTPRSYEIQPRDGTTFHHHFLLLLVVQELILSVFADKKTRVRVTRKCMGYLMTSLKRDGFSLTLLKALTSWEECLGEETHLSPNLSCLHILYSCEKALAHVNLHTGVLLRNGPQIPGSFYRRFVLLFVVLDLPTTAPGWPNVSFVPGEDPGEDWGITLG